MSSTVDLCLLCLTNNVNIKCILSQNSDGIVIEEKCRYVLNEYINIKPEVSYHICLNCLKTLDYVYNFKQICLKNINKLNNYIDTLKNEYGPNKPYNVTLADLQRLENNELTFCNESANEGFPQVEVVLVKEEIADNYEENEEEEALSEDHEFTNKENPKAISDDTQYSAISYADGHKENFPQDVKEETEFKDIHEEIHIKDEQLVCETIYSDSEDNSNDKLENEEANFSENVSTSSSYSENNKPSQPDKKTTQLYECDICNKTFTRTSNLKNHKRIHTGERPFKCKYCNKSFSAKNNFLKHTRRHTGENLHKCDLCPKKFVNKIELKNHIRVHTGERPFECNICNQTFMEKSVLTRHQFLHTGEKPFKCDECNKSFAWSYYLKVHMRKHTGGKPHERTGERPHEHTEEKSYECDVCNKSFNELRHLKIHERIHTGERPFKCKHCDKTFSVESRLIIHYRTHTRESLYECDVCQKVFTQKRYLRYHERTHTGERPYECDTCKKTFMLKHSLTKHKRTHTKEMPHKCDECNKPFSRKDILTRHKIRFHTHGKS